MIRPHRVSDAILCLAALIASPALNGQSLLLDSSGVAAQGVGNSGSSAWSENDNYAKLSVTLAEAESLFLVADGQLSGKPGRGFFNSVQVVRQTPPAPIDKPNILVIMADDLGYETIGAYGGLTFETPGLDRMAAEGVRFSRMYASPVCTPSRLSLHTSLYPDEHGYTSVLPVHNGTNQKVDFENDFGTFAQLLRAAGYHTCTTGKWQLATLHHHPDHISSAGFDSWCVWQIWDGVAGAKTLRYWDPYLNRDGSKVPATAADFGPDLIQDYVFEKLQAAKTTGVPLMMVHNMLLPHNPIISTPDDLAAGRTGNLRTMVNYLDKLVGGILGEVDRLGLRDNTYVFFLGDNGTEYSDGLGDGNPPPAIRQTVDGPISGGKRDAFHPGCHVPLIVWGPESLAPAGTVIDDLVDITDIYPTVCNLAGVELPTNRTIRGRSIKPQMEGRPGLARPTTFGGIGGERTIFDGKWRLNADGVLRDSRHLPVETIVPAGNPEGDAARERLQELDRVRLLDLSAGDVVDDGDSAAVTVTGTWQESSATPGFHGTGYHHDRDSDKGSKSFAFRYTAPDSGDFTVALRWTSHDNRATNVPVAVTFTGFNQVYTIDQTSGGGAWNTLDTLSLDAGTEVTVELSNTGTNGYVVADAVRISPTDVSTTFRVWQREYFDPSDLENPGLESILWGAAADPDFDQKVNTLEYASGGHPLIADAGSCSPILDVDDDGIAVQWIRRVVGTGESIAPLVSPTLQPGSWVPPESAALTLSDSNRISRDFEELIFRHPTALADFPRLFFKTAVAVD